MSDSDRPETAAQDNDFSVAGQEPSGAAVPGGDTPASRTPRRAPWPPWWRPAAAALAVGALTWGVTASDATLSLGDGTRAGLAAATPDARAGAFVQSAVVSCPGPAPWLEEGAEGRPTTEVLAAVAPRSVLDAVPPRAAADGGEATAVPDAAEATASADASEATSSPDAAAPTTAGPDGEPADGAASTSAPESAAATATPDDAAATAGPEGATATSGPDDAAVTGRPGDGPARLRTTGEDGPSVPLQRGAPAGFVVEGATSAVAEADDGMAPALAGGQVGLGAGAGSRGLTVTGCVQAAELQWLVGGGSAPGRSEQLVLTNPGPDAATVEVSVWGADGPVRTTGGSGIVVPGGGRVVELLDAVAPGVEAPVVAVAATGGPVVAHLAEVFREGTTDRGTEVVAPVAAPSTDLVVPALPAAPEGYERTVVLRVGAPGQAEAVVDLTALTADGAVRLTDHVTRVPAGHTVDVELDDLPAGATALRLRSDEPVTGGARLEVLPAEGEPEVVEAPSTADDASSTADDAPSTADDASATAGPGTQVTAQDEPLLRFAGDVAWVGATVPSTAPTGMALPDRAAVPGGTASLALTAVDGTTAWVTWVDADAQETSQSLTLPNDTTVLVEVPAAARAVWVVGAGPAGVASAVHLAGADERGPLLASATVPDLPWLRQVTQVRPVVP